ncbi:hypothetical protein BGZ65_002134 [Modicella reniformis]|uniref:Crinkler effector protein N-terminal domain-containing protein n=1 Tax=Modicella reniformis TaxID=1440133 RepID=A0A9P6SUE7_9FUNG|nr:hypothetical protein BGZ65_002134 [Modicella reniformis]
MANLKLFCLADGEPTSSAFPVDIASASTIGDLKKAIKAKNKNIFKDIYTKELSLWKVSVSNMDDEQPISLDSSNSPDIFKEKKNLLSGSHISDVFPSEPDMDTYVLIQAPPPRVVMKRRLEQVEEARAYAEGWPVLYIADAGALVTGCRKSAAMEVVKRFFVLNKDILTATELEELVEDYDGTYDVAVDAISTIFRKLLKQRERKTLLIIDDHWKLFETTPSIPTQFSSLNPLQSFHWWGEDAKWTRVIFTGTSHAKYEMESLEETYRATSLVFVRPLSERVFLKLLDTHPHLNLPEIKDEVKAITNYVPQELVRLSYFTKLPEDEEVPVPIKDVLQSYTVQRTSHFEQLVSDHYNSSQIFWKKRYYHALASIFLDGTSATDFEWNFLDLGLVYRCRDGPYKPFKYHILSRPAQKALLELFKTLKVPEDIKRRIRLGEHEEDDFEKTLFHQLVCATEPILLNTTDLNDQNPTTITLDFVDCDTIKADNVSLGRGYDRVLYRAYKGYPGFDYILGSMFIQVSMSDFESHNKGSADIQEAFKKGFHGDMNQIECCMNDMFGPGHSAEIEKDHFVVTRNGVPVPGFRVVYIQGSSGKPAHGELVNKFPDVAHITFEEVREKLFGLAK